MHTISRFKYWEVRSPALQTVCDLEVKWRSYGRLKTSAQSWARISQPRHHLEGCFATAKPIFGTRVPFCSTVPLISKLRYICEITFELRNHFLAHESHFAAPYTHFRAAKSLLSFEMDAKWSPSFRMAAKMIQASKWLWNHLQASKWPSNCEIDLWNGGWFAKTLCKAKEKLLKCHQSPATMHLKRRAPRTLGSHTLSLSIHFWPP